MTLSQEGGLSPFLTEPYIRRAHAPSVPLQSFFSEKTENADDFVRNSFQKLRQKY